MTSLLTSRDTHAVSAVTAAQRLRATMAAVRVSFTWLGTRKTLTPEQRAIAAQPFHAEGPFLSAGKKLLDTKHATFRAVTAVRGQIEAYWRAVSLPFPEPGVRLVRQDQVEAFSAQMIDFKVELADAVAGLDQDYAQLKAAAAARLGQLYNPADYPDSLLGMFDVCWDFPSVEPPDYLLQLNTALYEQERARVAARFEEAVQLAEQAFTEELARLVNHLCERLAGSDDGQPKVFRDSAVGNLGEFFERFRQLNVRSSQELDELVDRAQRVVCGVGAQELRDSASLRQRVTQQLSQVQSALDALLVDRPRRRILRTASPAGES
jgi:hypothetical protein